MPRSIGADLRVCVTASDSGQTPAALKQVGLPCWPDEATSSGLIQPGAPKAFQIVFAVGIELPGQLARDPGQRNIRLDAAQLLERGLRDLDLAGHAGRDREHAVGTGEVA